MDVYTKVLRPFLKFARKQRAEEDEQNAWRNLFKWI
jgi:hypothetical protein